jgi:hypothetical protein
MIIGVSFSALLFGSLRQRYKKNQCFGKEVLFKLLHLGVSGQ